MCSGGSQWERDHLLFRDYLRAHPSRRDGDAGLKENLVARHGYDRLAYTDAKTRFVAETLILADEGTNSKAETQTGTDTD